MTLDNLSQTRNINIPLFSSLWYNKIMKNIVVNPPYITLGQFLKLADVICSGSDAKLFLQENKVFVNSEFENRRGRKLYKGFVIKVLEHEFLIEM